MPDDKDTQDSWGDPIVCPFCRSEDIVFANGWATIGTQEKENVALDLDEYHCRRCNNRSFWV